MWDVYLEQRLEGELMLAYFAMNSFSFTLYATAEMRGRVDDQKDHGLERKPYPIDYGPILCARQ